MHREADHASGIGAWLRLIGAEGIGPATCKRLIAHFDSPERVLRADPASLAQVDGIGPAKARKIATSRDRFDADREISLADRLGATIIHIQDPRYPVALRRIYDPLPTFINPYITRFLENLVVFLRYYTAQDPLSSI